MAQGQDPMTGLHYWQLAAEQSLSNAQVSIAICYLIGKQVPKNDPFAFQLLKKAADQQSPIGELTLSYCYFYGRGTDKNNRLFHHYQQQGAQNQQLKQSISLLALDEGEISSFDEACQLIQTWFQTEEDSEEVHKAIYLMH